MTHEFQVPLGQPYFEERITIKNCGENTYEVEDIELGFRKGLCPIGGEEPSKEGLGDFHLVAVPYRRLALTMEHFYFKAKKGGGCIKRYCPLLFNIPEYYGFRKL